MAATGDNRVNCRTEGADRVEMADGFALYGHAGAYMFDVMTTRRTWELATAAVIREHLKPGGTFVDVGAGLGYYTVLASRALGRAGRVLSFEPHPENYRCMMMGLAAVNAGNVSAYAVALGARLTATRLWANPVNEGNNRVGGAGNADWLSFGCVTVPLDVFIEALPGPVVMKIDVEGGEPDVIAGAHGFISRHRPFIVAENNEGIYGDALTAGLTALGYDVTPLHNKDIQATPR
jgi:FkbM family methyltransferase